MPTKRNTKKGIQERLNRALASIDAKSKKFPHIPRSGYELSQQEAYVKKHPGSMDWRTGNIKRKIDRMVDYGDNQYAKRRQQLIETANRLMANASNGG